MQTYNRPTENKSDVADDPKARELLRRANEKTYRWPEGFKGFSADLVVRQAGKTAKGRVTLKSARDLSVRMDDPEIQEWAEGQIAMMAVHRSARPFQESDGKYSLTLGEEDGDPMGRLVYIHGDNMGSHYRVQDDRITQINRQMERMAFTINVEDTLTTPDGRNLTTRYCVYYFSPKDNRLANVESYTDRHAVVEGIHLPGTRRISFVAGQKVVTRSLEFLNHALL
jgi:hypothetical protein